MVFDIAADGKRTVGPSRAHPAVIDLTCDDSDSDSDYTPNSELEWSSDGDDADDADDTDEHGNLRGFVVYDEEGDVAWGEEAYVP